MANSAVVGVLRALLTANTAQYDQAFKKSTVITGQFGKATQQLTEQAKRMADALGGDKMLARANNLVAAVNKIGGASKLTASEQGRVNAQITEAIAKYQAIGQKAPKAMVDLALATKGAGQPTSFLTTKMIALGAAVGTFAGNLMAQAVRGIVNWGRESIRTASSLVDLSAKTGETLTSLQRMKFVAEQTGGSLETFTNAAFMLRQRLAGGGVSVLKALEDLQKESGATGLSVRSSADQILTALSKVTDANTQMRLGTELFGRSFRELAAGVVQGYGQMADAAALATDAQLKALDAAADRWAKFETNTKTRIAAILGSALQLSDAIQEVIQERGIFASGIGVFEEAMRRVEQRKTGAIFGPPAEAQAAVERLKSYVQELNEAKKALDGLTAANRAELAAAQQLGASQEEQITLLSKWGVSATQAEGVLKLFTVGMDAAKKEARELSQMIDNNRIQLKRFDAIIQDAAKAGIPLKTVLAEFGPEIDKAVGEAIVFGNTVKPTLMAVSAEFVRLGMVAKEALREMEFGEFLRAVPDEVANWSRVFDAIDLKQQQSLERRQEASIQAAEFDIALAQRRGANEQQLFALNERLERARLDVALGAEEARFEIATRGIDRQTELFKQLEHAHQDTVNHLNRQWEIGVFERSALFESEAERLGKAVRQQFTSALTGNLGSLFFGQIGHDVTGELKAAADEAQQDFLRIQRSGKATAQELKLAFDRWREAEERANFTFGERWKQWLGGLKSTFVNILNDMLEFFTRQFIGGLIKGLTGAKFGQALGNFLTGATEGLGGLAGGAIPGGVLTGIGGGVTTGAGLATTTNALGFAVTPGLATAGTPVAPGVAGAGGGGALGFLSNPAFWTNPWTIGIGAGTALLTWAIAKKGLFRGGEEGVQVNPRRDQFQLANFGRSGESVAQAGMRLAAQLTTWSGQPGGGPLFAAMQAADSVKEWERAQAAIVAEFKRHGTGLQSFQFGGFTPPNVTQLALLHGGRMGELHIPVESIMRQPPVPNSPVVNNYNFAIRALDSEDVQKFLEREFWPRHNREMQLNQFGGASSVTRVRTR